MLRGVLLPKKIPVHSSGRFCLSIEGSMKYGRTFPSTGPQVVTVCGQAVRRLMSMGNTGLNKVSLSFQL